jgi:2-polyprenyl-3-methyl-5-hydroxy-6-metoxy-1,4-benzoquinol methylase
LTTLEVIVALNRDPELNETDPFTGPRYQQRVRHLSQDARDVLDVGCSTGRGGAVMKAVRPNLRITGVDCVPERIAVLDSEIYHSKICGFTHAITLRTDNFDAIVTGEFIEHLSPDLVFPTLCEFFRLLRLRGQLLLTTPNPRYLKNRIQHAACSGEFTSRNITSKML